MTLMDLDDLCNATDYRDLLFTRLMTNLFTKKNVIELMYCIKLSII